MSYEFENEYDNVILRDKDDVIICLANHIRFIEKHIPINSANGCLGEILSYTIIPSHIQWSKEYKNFNGRKLYIRASYYGLVLCEDNFNVNRNLDTGAVIFSS